MQGVSRWESAAPPAQSENALIATRQSHPTRPGKLHAGGGSQLVEIGVSGEESEPAFCSNHRNRRTNGLFHLVDSAQSYTIEHRTKCFGAGCMDFDGEAEKADCFAEESGLFAL